MKLVITLPTEPDDVIVITRIGDEISVNLSSGLDEAAAFRLLKEARHTLADEGMPDVPVQEPPPLESPLVLPHSPNWGSGGVV